MFIALSYLRIAEIIKRMAAKGLVSVFQNEMCQSKYTHAKYAHTSTFLSN